jgi:hypothetical protein
MRLHPVIIEMIVVGKILPSLRRVVNSSLRPVRIGKSQRHSVDIRDFLYYITQCDTTVTACEAASGTMPPGTVMVVNLYGL